MTASSDDINMHFLLVSDSKLIVFRNFMGENFVFFVVRICMPESINKLLKIHS